MKVARLLLFTCVLSFTALIAACSAPTAPRPSDAGSSPSTAPRTPTGPTLFGHDQGNAADHPTYDDGAAWFTGKENTVHFCVEAASDFGFSKEQLEGKVAQAYLTWSNYMKEKGISSYEEPRGVKALVHCDGSEDLRFLFGVTNEAVNLNRARYSNPIAITVRTSYDDRKGWARGFIWFAPSGSVTYGGVFPLRYPDWSLTGNLDTILLHELGHVHGIGHIEGTIMTAEITNTIKKNRQDMAPPSIHTIDAWRELVFCDTCNTPVKGRLGVAEETTITTSEGTKVYRIDTQAENFERLIGRKPQGEIEVELAGNTKGGYRLLFSDSLGHADFRIALHPYSESKTIGTPVFKSIRTPDPERGNITTYSAASHLSSVTSGTITTLRNETLEVSLQRNMRIEQPFPKTDEPGAPERTEVVSPLMIVIQEESGAKVLFAK